MFTRLFLMARHVVTSLAVFHRRGLEADPVGFDTYLSDMVDAVAGYLSAPPSAQTLAFAKLRDERFAERQGSGRLAGNEGGAP